ncbi:MAG: hypothetical protein V3S29_03725 [bacterium]
MTETQPNRAEQKKVWLAISHMTEEEFDRMMAAQMARQPRVPQPGTAAPDFELDVLDRARQRTGQTVRLSSLRGRPVGLIFGSWT